MEFIGGKVKGGGEELHIMLVEEREEVRTEDSPEFRRAPAWTCGHARWRQQGPGGPVVWKPNLAPQPRPADPHWTWWKEEGA